VKIQLIKMTPTAKELLSDLTFCQKRAQEQRNYLSDLFAHSCRGRITYERYIELRDSARWVLNFFTEQYFNLMEQQSIQQFMDAHRKWADDTFGENRPASAPAAHLQKESKELFEALRDNHSVDEILMEFADCWILLHHAAALHGLSADKLFEAAKIKFEIAKKRKWGKPDENGVIQHIKE
jgi:NTP pyrophosphatase (non-canonical NTP hydrolase)